jgi:hypothetical protein
MPIEGCIDTSFSVDVTMKPRTSSRLGITSATTPKSYTFAPCNVGSSRWNNIVNMETHCTTDREEWSKKILSISDEAFILLCWINYGKRWFTELAKAEKMVRKKFVLLLVSAAANTFSVLLSIKQKKDQWTEEDSKNLPVSAYPVRKNNEELKRKRLQPASLQNFPASTLYVLQEQGCP